jgi:hypothetical protein
MREIMLEEKLVLHDDEVSAILTSLMGVNTA